MKKKRMECEIAGAPYEKQYLIQTLLENSKAVKALGV